MIRHPFLKNERASPFGNASSFSYPILILRISSHIHNAHAATIASAVNPAVTNHTNYMYIQSTRIIFVFQCRLEPVAL